MAGSDILSLFGASIDTSASASPQQVLAQYKKLTAVSDNAANAAAELAAKKAASTTETDYFKREAPLLTSVDDLIADSRIMDYVMTAYGSTGAQKDWKGMQPLVLKQLISSDTTDPNSFANTFENGKYKSIATALEIANLDIGKFTRASFQTATVEAYEKALGINAAPTERTVEDDEVAKFAERNDIKQQAEYFRAAVSQMTDIEDFFKNTRALTFALTAFGLESEAQNIGKMRAIMNSDLADIDSLANRFQDARFNQITKAFDFFASGISKLGDSAFIDSIVDKYNKNTYEIEQDQANPGLRAALNFKRSAPTQATSALAILGDSVMRAVVTTAQSIPKEIAYQTTETQAAVIERQIDIASMKNADYIDKIIGRYITNLNSPTNTSQSTVLSLFT